MMVIIKMTSNRAKENTSTKTVLFMKEIGTKVKKMAMEN